MSNTRGVERTAWLAVALVWFVAMLNYGDRQLIVAMGQPIKAGLHWRCVFRAVFLGVSLG